MMTMILVMMDLWSTVVAHYCDGSFGSIYHGKGECNGQSNGVV